MREIKRQEHKRGQILDVLRINPNGVTNVQLSEVSLRYGGHLGRLYELGYKIEKVPLGDGVFRYRLLSEPEREISDRVKAVDKLLHEVKKRDSVDAETLEAMLDRLGISVRYKPNTYNI